MYAKDGDEFLLPGKSNNIDLDVSRAREHLGAI